MSDPKLIDEHDRRVLLLDGRRYLVLSLAELYWFRQHEPHRLVEIAGDWCVKSSDDAAAAGRPDEAPHE